MADSQELIIEIEDEHNLDVELEDEQNLDIDLGYDVVKITDQMVYSDTTENWNSQRSLIGKYNCIYVYTDYRDVDGEPVPGIKMGDGTSYLIDLPFVMGDTRQLYDHISDIVMHVSSVERESWNNKVTCYISPTDSEELVFSRI